MTEVFLEIDLILFFSAILVMFCHLAYLGEATSFEPIWPYACFWSGWRRVFLQF